MNNEQAIEVIAPPKRKHAGETTGGNITIFRIKLLAADQIAEYGLEKYANRKSGGDYDANAKQRDLDA